MSRAARDLFVSQPALSLVVKKLENELNAKLFIRKGNSLALTLAGEHLLKTGKRLLAEHDSLVTDLKSLSSGKQEVIRFGISSFYSRLYIPDLFLYYEKNLPSVKREADPMAGCCNKRSKNYETVYGQGFFAV